MYGLKKTVVGVAAAMLLMGGSAIAQDKPLKIIYVTHSDAGNAFWLSVKKGMDDACALLKADCQMLFVSKAGDIQGQVANIQSAAHQRSSHNGAKSTDSKNTINWQTRMSIIKTRWHMRE